MSVLNKATIWAGAWIVTAAAAFAGAAPPPAVETDNSDGAVAMFLILGALVVIGSLAKPKAPPPGDG